MAGDARKQDGEKIVARNRRAGYDYNLEDKYEAGLVLTGSEVKSLRAGKCEIVDAYALIDRGQAWLEQLYIAPFEQASFFGHEPRRRRKLLMKRKEIDKLAGTLKDRGYTLIPLRVYFKERYAKIELALARGKTKGDRRQAIAAKDAARDQRNALGRTRKGG